MTTIRKVVLELTLLLEDAGRDRIDHLSLEQIAREMDEGSFIGTVTLASDTIVPPSNVKEALKALGNDGSFFSDDWRGGS